jgi:probable rRNA maturation factor
VALSRFLTQAMEAVRLQGEVNVLVTSSQELRQLNRRFRGKNQPTDVLSFPAISGVRDAFTGDVAISADIAAKNARLLGHSTAEEIKILTLHGLLHLAGYDHERDQGEMSRKEKRLRKLLGLLQGLVERSEQRNSALASKGVKPSPKVRRKASPTLISRERTRRTISQ